MNFLGLARACVMICRSGSGLWINGKPNAFFIEHTSHAFAAARFFVVFGFLFLFLAWKFMSSPFAMRRVCSSVNYLVDCSNYESIPIVLQIFGHRRQPAVVSAKRVSHPQRTLLQIPVTLSAQMRKREWSCLTL